jgi:hypothetical protein
MDASIESMNHQVRDAVWTSVPVKIVVFCPVAIGTPLREIGERKKVVYQALVVGFHPRRYNQRRTRALY